MPVISVRRNIELGKRFTISPSYGFLGIEDGVVEVIKICNYDDLVQEDGNVQTLVDNDKNLKFAIWVVYGYVSGTDDDTWYPLPIDLFAEHISFL